MMNVKDSEKIKPAVIVRYEDRSWEIERYNLRNTVRIEIYLVSLRSETGEESLVYTNRLEEQKNGMFIFSEQEGHDCLKYIDAVELLPEMAYSILKGKAMLRAYEEMGKMAPELVDLTVPE